MADILLVSSVKLGEIIVKTRATSAVWRTFADLKNPKRALSKVNLTSMEVSMF